MDSNDGRLSGNIPEMSAEAFEYGIKQRYNAIEIDVWLTKDNEIICNHDGSLIKSLGIDKNIYELNLNEIQKNGFKDNKNRKLSKNYVNNLLTLEFILNEYIVKHKELFLFLEIKDSVNTWKLADKILGLLKKYNDDIIKRIVVISFYPFVMHYIKRKSNCKLQIGLLSGIVY